MGPIYPGIPPAGPPEYLPTANGPLILVVGILSLLLTGLWCGPILGPIAWIMGNRALKAIDAGTANPSERVMVYAGRICGIVAAVSNVLFIGAFISLRAAGVIK
jgi:hypothetical protein